MEYYISVNNEKRGPYSIEELKARGLKSETLVMPEDSDQWIPAWQVEELRAIIQNSESKVQNYDNQDKQDLGTEGKDKGTDNQAVNNDNPSNEKVAEPIDGQKIDDFVEGEPINNKNSFAQAPYQKAYANNAQPNYGNQTSSPSGRLGEEPRRYGEDSTKKGGCLKSTLIGLIILAIIVGLAVVTCPDSDAHKAALTNVIASAVSEEVNGNDSTDAYDDTVDKMFRQISDTWTQRVIATAVDNLIHVDNHFVFSTGKVRYAGKEHTVSLGVFGHVFTIDKDDLKAAAEQYYSKAERDTKEDLKKKAEKIINENVIDPAAQAIKEMINGAMNDIMQDVGITGGDAGSDPNEAEPEDSTSR